MHLHCQAHLSLELQQVFLHCLVPQQQRLIRLHIHQGFQLYACLHRICTLSHNLSRIMDLIPVEEVQIHFMFTSLQVTSSVSATDVRESTTKKLDPLMTFVYSRKSGAHSHRQAQVTSRVVLAMAMYTIIALQCCLYYGYSAYLRCH